MVVTDEYVAALRAFLTSSDDTFSRLSAQIQDRDGSGSGNVYAAMQVMALTLAARSRFAPSYTAAQVIKFVAQVRSALGARGIDVDPLIAERLLRGLLGEPASAGTLDEHARAVAVPALLLVLAGPGKLPGGELEALLARARVLANHLLAAMPDPAQS